VREAQLRLEEAERRARIEAQAKLEEARIQAEAQIRVSKKVPVRLIVGITLGVMVIAGGTIGYIINQHQEEQRIAAAENERRLREERERAEKDKAERLSELQASLTKATSEVERAKIRQQMAEEQSAAARRQHSK